MAFLSIVMSPPVVDDTGPTVATAETFWPSDALPETVARPSAPIVAIDGSVVLHAGAGAPATG